MIGLWTWGQRTIIRRLGAMSIHMYLIKGGCECAREVVRPGLFEISQCKNGRAKTL
jgi:hypothetical protein